MLDVTRLRVLVAVARHGSVTAAARELNYAQPSVSHHLARLEAETGVRLIQRAGRGIRLTEAGRLLADRAAEVLGRLDAAENELAAHAGLRAGRVRLAAFPSALGTIVPAAAAMLQAGHPSMDLRLTEAEPPEALRMLRAGYVDVALVFRHVSGPLDGAVPPARAAEAPAGPEEEGTRGRLILDEPVHLVTRRKASGGPTGYDLARYAQSRWIAGCDRCRIHRHCAYRARSQPVGPPLALRRATRCTGSSRISRPRVPSSSGPAGASAVRAAGTVPSSGPDTCRNTSATST